MRNEQILVGDLPFGMDLPRPDCPHLGGMIPGHGFWLALRECVNDDARPFPWPARPVP